MSKVNLYNAICAIAIQEASKFISNRIDNGEFFDQKDEYPEDIEIEQDELPGIILEFAKHMDAAVDDPENLEYSDVNEATIDIHDFIQLLEDMPALYVKHTLMSYFGESIHNGWDGWLPYEGRVLERMMFDFSLGHGDDPKSIVPETQGFSLWGVDCTNTK